MYVRTVTRLIVYDRLITKINYDSIIAKLMDAVIFASICDRTEIDR